MKFELKNLHEEFVREIRYASRLSEETIRGYISSFELLLKILPDLQLDLINPKMMTLFFERLEKRERMVGKGQLKKGIKKTTVATYRSKLNKFFEWLRAKSYIKENPFRDMPYPAVNFDDRKFLSRHQVETILLAVALNVDWKNELIKKRNVAMFSVLLFCGIRKGELLGLSVLDIDFNRMEIKIQPHTSKSKRPRVLPLHSIASNALKEFLEERKRAGYKNPALWVSENKDERFTKHGLKHMIEIVKKKSGVKFHLHQFRHTYAVNILNSGCDVAKVKQLLGHTDIRMTVAYLRCLPTSSMRSDVENLTIDNFI